MTNQTPAHTLAEGEVILFKNRHGNCNVALKSGNTIPFVQSQAGGGPGRFFTVDKRLQSELAHAAEQGEFGVYIDPKEPAIDPAAATPMQQLEKKIRADILAEMASKQVEAGTSHVTAEQTQQAMGTSQGAVAGQGAAGPGEVVVQPEGSQTPALSMLEKIKLGNKPA